MTDPSLDPSCPELLNHLLATLRYRTAKALADSEPGFGTFRAGEGVRTPLELLEHMVALIEGISARLRETERAPVALPTLDEARARFDRSLHELAHLLGSIELRPDTARRLLQGPLSDAMTHVGQLAMLRRISGAPIRGENFMKADIEPLGP